MRVLRFDRRLGIRRVGILWCTNHPDRGFVTNAPYHRLIAIMLGRLEMDIDQCINAYKRLSNHVFARKRLLPVGGNLRRQSKYDGRRIETAMKAILHELGYEDDILLREPASSCKV